MHNCDTVTSSIRLLLPCHSCPRWQPLDIRDFAPSQFHQCASVNSMLYILRSSGRRENETGSSATSFTHLGQGSTDKFKKSY